MMQLISNFPKYSRHDKSMRRAATFISTLILKCAQLAVHEGCKNTN